MRKRAGLGIKPLMLSIIIATSILMCMTFAILSFNNNSSKRLAYNCLSDKAGLYIELLEKEMEKVSQSLKIMQIRDLDVLWEIPKQIAAQDTKYYDVWAELEEYNFSKETEYNHKYSFYEYVYDANLLMIGEATYFETSAKPSHLLNLNEKIRKICEENYQGIVWDFFTVNDQNYLYGCFQQRGIAVGCITTLDTLLEDIKVTNMGYEGYLVFEDENRLYADNRFSSLKDADGLMSELQLATSKVTKDYVWETYEIKHLGNVRIVIALTDGVLDQIEYIQILSVIIFGCLFFLVLFMLWQLYSGILWPMKKFVDRLKNPDEDIYLNQKKDEGPLEIVYASEQFKKMYREIQSLRIDVYEKELAEKRIMLEYTQTQIRPHFFLNCMSVVQSMAELHHEEDIVQILDVLSEYMRYVLKDTFKLRCVREEVKHVCNYMEMQKLCKPNTFIFNAWVEQEVEDCQILPLLLQVFAENAVKHGLVSGQCIEITIYITSMEIESEKYLYISVSDTGKGFSDETLELIKQQKPVVYDGCEHIGIYNTLQRIQMAYGEKAEVKFGNMKKNYGAVVEIMLPMERGSKENYEIQNT